VLWLDEGDDDPLLQTATPSPAVSSVADKATASGCHLVALIFRGFWVLRHLLGATNPPLTPSGTGRVKETTIREA